jgi:hypothetical protein
MVIANSLPQFFIASGKSRQFIELPIRENCLVGII